MTISHLFECDLPVPGGSQYTVLGLSPEAMPNDVRDAQRDFILALNQQKNLAEREIEQVSLAVPGLAPAIRELERLRNSSGNAAAVLAAEKILADQQALAQLVNPLYSQLLERVRKLEFEINDLNKLDLANPAKRLEYDQANPPFELLKLADCERNELADPPVALALLRQSMVEFLDARGEEIYHPSDLTRRDFRSDYTFHPLLDGDV